MQGTNARGTGYAWLAALLAVALFGALMAGYFVPASEGVDQNGYIGAARRLALTGSAAKHTAHPLEYVSDNVVETAAGVYYPKYPLGYPWLGAFAWRLGGPDAVFLVNPILAALAVAGMFLLTRAMVNAYAGALAAILLLTNPWHAIFGLTALSHSGAIAFAVWAMYFLWRWVATGGRLNAFAAGALTAYACTIRYSEALLALPVFAMIAWRYSDRSKTAAPPDRPHQLRQWRRDALLMLAGALVLVTPLLVYHWTAFGAPWRTGYGLCGESTGFGWKWFQQNWWVMLTKLNTPGLLFVFPVGLAGLAYVIVHDGRRATLLGLWALPSILLYTAYYWAPAGEGAGYLRFFISVFPPLIICALVLLCEAVKPRPVWSVALGVFIAVAATFNLRATIKEVAAQTDRLQDVRTMETIVRRAVPDGAVLLATAPALNSLELVGDYELYSTATFDRRLLTWRTGALKRTGPQPFQRRKAAELEFALGKLNNSELAAVERSLLSSNLAAGRFIAAVAAPIQLRSLRGQLGEAFSYQLITEWSQVSFTTNNEPRPTPLALYRLEPRAKHPPPEESLAAIEEKIDRLQFRLKTMREAFDDQYPGARQKWDEITAADRQLRDWLDNVKRRTTRAPALKPLPPSPGPMPNAPAGLPSPVPRTNAPPATLALPAPRPFAKPPP